jgi:hypothetical protein
MVDDTPLSLDEGQDVHYETYHDSCWRDGISRMIRSKADSICKELEKAGVKEKNINTHTSFNIFDPKVIDGNIVMNDDDRTAKFTKKLREF